MTDQAAPDAVPATPEAAPLEPEGAAKVWRPSGRPTHRDRAATEGRIVEIDDAGGILARIVRFLKRPFVKLLIGLGFFILAAIVYDETVNYGSWTERKAKPKAGQHGDADPVPRSPD